MWFVVEENMSLKIQAEIDELVKYTRWYGGFNNECEAWIWMNENMPSWMQKHDTVITYAERMGED